LESENNRLGRTLGKRRSQKHTACTETIITMGNSM